MSTEDSSRAAEAERLLREQSPLPLGGRQPEVSGGEHSHDAELDRASAYEFSDADDRAARHSGADASESRLRTMLETSMRENEFQRVLVRELQADVEDLKDPRKQFERAQQISMDPAWRATAGIGKNKLSAAQINRLQSYKLSEEVIVQLVSNCDAPLLTAFGCMCGCRQQWSLPVGTAILWRRSALPAMYHTVCAFESAGHGG